MYARHGLGADSATQAALQFDPTLAAILPSGLDLSSLSSSAATLLSTPISVGQNSAPLWAFGALFVASLWLVTSLASVGKRATKRVTGRARKIKRGFLN